MDQNKDDLASGPIIKKKAGTAALPRQSNRPSVAVENLKPWQCLKFCFRKFWDMRASHWIQVGLTLGLLAVALLQYGLFKSQNADARVFQRAFLNVPKMNVELITREDTGKQQRYWRFTPTLSNDGNTPTRDMLYISGADSFYDGSQPTSPVFGVQGVQHFNSVPVIGDAPKKRLQLPLSPDVLWTAHKDRIFTFVGAHGQRQGGYVELTEDNLKWAVKHGWATYFYGEATYKEQFEDSPQHTTMFCFALLGEEGANGWQARSGPCAFWNCTDDECKNNRPRYEAAIAYDTSVNISEPPIPTKGFNIETN